MKRFLSDTGAALTEYGLTIAFVCLLVIPAVNSMAHKVGGPFCELYGVGTQGQDEGSGSGPPGPEEEDKPNNNG